MISEPEEEDARKIGKSSRAERKIPKSLCIVLVRKHHNHPNAESKRNLPDWGSKGTDY